MLFDRSEMLEEYFAIKIDDKTSELLSLPALMPKQFPLPLENLPQFFMRLGPTIDWSQEKPCLEGIARELARACVPVASAAISEEDVAGLKWTIEHAWFACMHAKRGAYQPSKQIQQRAIFQVAAMSDLCECHC
jgi:DNA mismatch repair protein MLH1